jgi:hypothetical protein
MGEQFAIKLTPTASVLLAKLEKKPDPKTTTFLDGERPKGSLIIPGSS